MFRLKSSQLPKGRKQEKYGNELVELDGITFQSKKEANRYLELLWLMKAGEITKLTRQPRFKITINDILIGEYVSDFLYLEKGETKWTVEDSKGCKTDLYKWKSKCFKALYPQFKFIES